jgi:vacuolar-type H+-ATPase subunit H
MILPDGLPMHDVVKLVLQAEAQARRILEDAEAEAERLGADARSRAQEIVQTMRRETAEQADAIVTTAEQEALRERRQRLAQAAVEIETAVQLDRPSAQAVVDGVIRCINGTSQPPLQRGS